MLLVVRRRAALVRSDAVVALGATAAQALLGGSVKIMRDRGRPIDVAAAFMILVTVYPSLSVADPRGRGLLLRAGLDPL
nr:hypothetical protein FA04_18365 [Ensifer adhaerens]